MAPAPPVTLRVTSQDSVAASEDVARGGRTPGEVHSQYHWCRPHFRSQLFSPIFTPGVISAANSTIRHGDRLTAAPAAQLWRACRPAGRSRAMGLGQQTERELRQSLKRRVKEMRTAKPKALPFARAVGLLRLGRWSWNLLGEKIACADIEHETWQTAQRLLAASPCRHHTCCTSPSRPTSGPGLSQRP